MFEWLWHYFAGWAEIQTDVSCRSVLAAMLWQAEIPFWHEENDGERLSVRIPVSQLQQCLEAAEACGLCCETGRQGGFPLVLRFCLHRPGIPLGIILFLAWCLYSQNLIWNMEIDGCVHMDESAVERILTEAGCGVGDFYPAIDFDALHATVKAENPEIAWLSVYMHGTTAEVQLRETKFPKDLSHPEGTYANVVAAEAGEVVSVDTFEGEAVVKTGDVVLPGEMLISGVVSMKNEGQSRTEYAAGEVWAKVAVPISVEVSLRQEEKEYTGRKKEKKSIKIFKKSINLFGNTGIPYTTYDTIDKMEEVCFLGRWSIPVKIDSTVYREYMTTVTERTPEEAAAEAMIRLREEMDKAIGAGEMLSRTVTAEITEDGVYRISCLLYVLRDIAATEEFTVRPGEGMPVS